MASIDPWTGARLGDMDDGPLGGFYLAEVVAELRKAVCPQFDTVSDRDAAADALIAIGGALVNGMSCWTDDVGFWDRIGGAWVARVTKPYVDGTHGDLNLIGGWAVFPGYHRPTWDLSANGRLVTLSGATLRTAADFELGTGDAYTFADMPAAIKPTTIASPSGGFVGVGAPLKAYPCRIHVTSTSDFFSVVGMDSGTGTMKQNAGFINLDGVSYRI